MRKDRVTITLCSIVLAGMTLTACAPSGDGTTASNASAECTREMLQKLADTYVSAQKAGTPATLPFAANASYAENDTVMDPATGVLAQALTVDFTRSFHDTTTCASFTELTAATHAHPYVIHTRMEATNDGQVLKMESVVTDEGDWVFGASEHLAVTQVENWGEIPADQRDTREAIQAAADAYIDNWGDPELPVPHGTPCSRLEGRMHITVNRNPELNPCEMGAFPQKLNAGNRRYVIDETVGAVSIFHDFPWLDAGLPPEHPGIPTSQTFRVEGGKNRYIHEVTACLTPGCGRGGPPGPPPPAPAAPGGA